MLNSSRDTNSGRYCSGDGEGEAAIYDPGAELYYYWEGSRVMRAPDGKNKRSVVYHCRCNNTIPKQVATIDWIWTDCCIMQSVHVQLL